MKIADLTDQELVAKEKKLRALLVARGVHSSWYERHYSDWFYLREAGLARGIFKTFVPTSREEGV